MAWRMPVVPGVHVNNGVPAVWACAVKIGFALNEPLPPLSIVKVFMPDLTGPFVLDRCAEVRLSCARIQGGARR